jgi:hypothetical protein
VNFISLPGVSLLATCFPFNIFEDANSADCFSNLLAAGFRRFTIDLYWDEGRRLWSFCPVALPNSISAANPVSISARATQFPPSITLSSAGTSFDTQNPFLKTGRDSSSGSSTISGSPTRTDLSSVTGITATLNETATSTGEVHASVAAYIESPNTPLVSIGPYSCTKTINLSTLTTQLRDHFSQTDDTINARLLYISINIHAATLAKSPLSSPSTPTMLPSGDALIGNILNQNISDWIYTPADLAANRRDVNGTWLTVAERYRPADEFYNVTLNEFDQASTEDGWPSESYIEFSQRKRLLIGWGTVDPQMSGYNFSGDAETIFPQNFIQNPVDATASSSGEATSGCFLRPNTENIQIAAVNSSWATASVPDFPYPIFPNSDLTPFLNLTSNLTSCGISPLLNHALLNVTAQQDYRPYQSFAYAAIWSWAFSEPHNYNSSNYRCALTSTSRLGRWIVADCDQHHYAACRASRQPYNWTTSINTVPYYSAGDACPSDFEFAAPRTALENSFLTQAMTAGSNVDTWVDFNAIDQPACWVMGGPHAECPYKEASWDQDYNRKRAILVCRTSKIHKNRVKY